jgi:hypothetical protein
MCDESALESRKQRQDKSIMRQQIPSLNEQNNSHTIYVPLLVIPTQTLLRHKQLVTTPKGNISKATDGISNRPTYCLQMVFSNDLSAAMLHGTE